MGGYIKYIIQHKLIKCNDVLLAFVLNEKLLWQNTHYFRYRLTRTKNELSKQHLTI